MPTGTSIVANTTPAITSRGSHVAWYWRKVSIPGNHLTQPI
jgi:hypothetical protein